jgi:tRNA A37 methylthiotransferase MiaB
LELVSHIREAIPGVVLSSDFIAGFCGETEEDHQATLELLEQVKYEQAFLFAYSMRDKTRAHRRLVDDVPELIKKRRLQELIDMHGVRFHGARFWGSLTCTVHGLWVH